MLENIDVADFWRRNGLDYIIPKKSPNEFPEGFDVLGTLREWLGDTVTEVGCGRGRLSPAFDNYTGYDINPAALEIARARYPGDKRFELMPDTVTAETVLLYTVLLHIPDKDLAAFLKRIKAERLLIAEIMDRSYRRPLIFDQVPVFNRSPVEYEQFGRVIRRQEYRYDYYPGVTMTWLLLEPGRK